MVVIKQVLENHSLKKFPADLVTFTEESLMENFTFCAVFTIFIDKLSHLWDLLEFKFSIIAKISSSLMFR